MLGLRMLTITSTRMTRPIANFTPILAWSGEPRLSSTPTTKPALEINVKHPLLQRIESTAEDATFDDLSMLLFEQATLADGGQLTEPAAFVQRLNRLLLTMH